MAKARKYAKSYIQDAEYGTKTEVGWAAGRTAFVKVTKVTRVRNKQLVTFLKELNPVKQHFDRLPLEEVVIIDDDDEEGHS